jgi:hypothetical protein
MTPKRKQSLQGAALAIVLASIPILGIWLLLSPCCEHWLKGNDYLLLPVIILLLCSPFWLAGMFAKAQTCFADKRDARLAQQLMALPREEREQKIKTLSLVEKADCLMKLKPENPQDLMRNDATSELRAQLQTAFWDEVGTRTQVAKQHNDLVYAKRVVELHEKLKATGWQVHIWGAEQGCAISPTGYVHTWISPNRSQDPSNPWHAEVRWHPTCNPPKAVVDWILYTLPEEGPKVRLTKSAVLDLAESPPESS